MRILILLSFLLLFAPAAVAAPEDMPEVKAVEQYLQNLHTFKSRFIQTANDGSRLSGDFMLQRPGRMRFQYDPPIEDFIVADGLFIYYYDGQLKEQKNAPISHSLADFFLRKDIRMSGDIQVTDVKRSGDLLQLTIVQVKDPDAGSLTLMLTEKPRMELKKWRVVDATGGMTEIELYDAVTGVQFKKDLFRYYDPKRRTPQYNK